MKNIQMFMSNKKTIIVLMFFFSYQILKAQDDKIKFSAVSRALQRNNTIQNPDTLNPNNTSAGNILLDLGININPDKRTEIQAIVRFNSNLGGFFGADAQASLRQLCVKGIVGKFLNYQVGDLYMQLTPYTFFNNNSEGSVNEATVFKDIRKDFTNYENFSNKGNAWWQQGVHTNMAVALQKLYFDTVRLDGFFLRNRTGNIAEIPSTFQAGGKLTFSKTKFTKFAINYLDLFDIRSSDKNKNLRRNPVTSFELNQYLINSERKSLKLVGEVGFSNLIDSATTIQGFFYDAGLQLHFKPKNIRIGVNYNYVDPFFYSSAAQSKRVDYGKVPSIFPTSGNDPLNQSSRPLSMYDLVADPTIYNASIVRTLMPYNMRYGNAQPYGKATPNRTGVEINTQYKDSAQKVTLDASAAYLSNIVGEGTEELRKFIVLKAGLNLNVHKFIGWEKQLIFTSGYMFESTNRGGTSVEKISFTNNLIDLGLTIEIIKKLDFLLGYKNLNSKGNEYYAIRDIQNNITDYAKIDNLNVTENIYAAGLKYRFSAASYLTLQNSFSSVKDKTDVTPEFSFNQFMILFNLNF